MSFARFLRQFSGKADFCWRIMYTNLVCLSCKLYKKLNLFNGRRFVNFRLSFPPKAPKDLMLTEANGVHARSSGYQRQVEGTATNEQVHGSGVDRAGHAGDDDCFRALAAEGTYAQAPVFDALVESGRADGSRRGASARRTPRSPSGQQRRGALDGGEFEIGHLRRHHPLRTHVTHPTTTAACSRCPSQVPAQWWNTYLRRGGPQRRGRAAKSTTTTPRSRFTLRQRPEVV